MALSNTVQTEDRYARALETLDGILSQLDLTDVSDDKDSVTLLMDPDKQPINKRIFSHAKVQPPPTPGRWTIAVRVPVADHSSIKRLLDYVACHHWLTLMPGICTRFPLRKPFLIASSGTLTGVSGSRPVESFCFDHTSLLAVARNTLVFSPSNWFPIDRDGLPDALREELSEPSAWWKAMGEAVSAFRHTRATIVPSTSLRVVYSDTGVPWKDSLGLHAWIHFKNGPDTQEELVALKRRIWNQVELAQLGRKVKGQKGGTKFDAIFDPSNFSSERPIFDGKPYLIRRRPHPRSCFF